MKRILDVIVTAAILIVPTLAVAQAPAASSVAVASGHHVIVAAKVAPMSATSPGGPGLM